MEELAAEGPLIVVVDDDRAIVNLLAESLADEGYRVATAGDRASALALIESARPALILMDLRLGPAAGVDLVAELRARLGALPPILVLSGASDLDVQGRALGAAAIFPKPFDLDTLLSEVARQMGR